MNNPLISIIVPLYNAERNIMLLMEGFHQQTFHNWELILVDDGSQDKTFELCQSFAKQDSRIRLIHQENNGPSSARNKGIKEAQGDWVSFVDADDYLLDNFLSSMATTVSNNTSVDIVYAGYIVATNSHNYIYTYKTQYYIGRSEIHSLLATTDILHRCCPWGKMFRRNVIIENNILFDEKLRHSEDRLFLYTFLLHTKGIATTSTIGYLYDSTSITSLKNKHLPPAMLSYRQEQLQLAANAVIDCFGLKGEECFMFAKNIFTLLAASIYSLFDEFGYTKTLIGKQQDFYALHFDKHLFYEVRGMDKWQKFVGDNKMLSLVLNQEFEKINRQLAFISIKRYLSQILYRSIHKVRTRRDFMDSVSIMNAK